MYRTLPVFLKYYLCLLLSLPALPGIAQVKTSNAILQERLRLQAKWSAADLASVVITKQYTDVSTGVEHIYAVQQYNGLDITGTSYSLHTRNGVVAESGTLLKIESLKIQPSGITLDAQAAVRTFMNAVHYDPLPSTLTIKSAATGNNGYTVLSRNSSAVWDIPCRLVYHLDARTRRLQKAWEILMMDLYKTHYWAGYVDASTGVLIEKKDLILHCNFGQHGVTDRFTTAVPVTPAPAGGSPLSPIATGTVGANNVYRVIDMPYESIIDPGASHSLVTNTGDVTASVDGWHKVGNAVTNLYTHGNNVWAFQDPSPTPLGGVPSADPTRTAYANNGIAGAPPLTEPLGFDYSFNTADDPTIYMKAAIVNLFYWNNLMHDVFYQFGFTEDAGNFEESHVFSTGTKGGAGALAGDEVLAQAQDGGGTNNANFLALVPDGISGQMQMYLWTASTPDSMVRISSSTSGVPAPGTKFYAVQGSFNSTVGNNDLYANPVLNKQIVLIQKSALSTVGSSSEGCSTGQQSIALPPSNNVSDKIVLIDRGTCSFVEKVLGAQLGGAAGVIIINNVPGAAPIAMGGSDAPGNAINIPAVMVTKETGDALKAQLTAGATLTGSLQRTVLPAPKRDGDLDNGVISHEYGHGISNRLTGGPNDLGGLSGDEQGGEGWSDYMALYMTLRTNDLDAATALHPNGVLPVRSIGNYVTYQPYNGQGIREYPYTPDMSVNPATFAYIKRPDYSETHSVGFVWCSILYEITQTMIDKYGMGDDPYEAANPVGINPPAAAKGNNIAMRLVFEGMKLQPTNPTFIQQRDAILKADSLLYGAQDACILWKAFAKRGLGYSATSLTNALGDEFEAFDVPLSCDPSQKRIRIEKSAPGASFNGSTLTYSIRVSNRYNMAITGVEVRDTLATELSFLSASNSPVVSGRNILWTLDFAPNEVKVLTLNVTLTSPSVSTALFSDDQESGSTKWTTSSIGTDNWTYTTDAANAYSGSKFWFAPDVDIPGSNMNLATNTPVAVTSGTKLVFIHKFSTEAGYDGGVVEISSDGGSNWTYLPPNKFTSNGYTKLIPTANNPLIGLTDLSAFSGSSSGYITSIADLNDYAGMNILIRFRMTSDPTGGSVSGGGWWIDNVYILKNPVAVTNSATAITTTGETILPYEGINAYSSVNTFVLAYIALATGIGDLSGALNNNTGVLKWNARNDEQAQTYTLERQQLSVDADFQPITNIGARQLNGLQEYTYTDPNLARNARYLYRVRQKGLNGSLQFTNTIVLQTKGDRPSLLVYPNPVNDVAQVTIDNPSRQKAVLVLYDASGKQLGTFTPAVAASGTTSLPVQSLPGGVYWLELKVGEVTITKQLVVKH